MAGAQGPVLGVTAMASMRRTVRAAPTPLMLDDTVNFLQEHGEVVARAALNAFP